MCRIHKLITIGRCDLLVPLKPYLYKVYFILYVNINGLVIPLLFLWGKSVVVLICDTLTYLFIHSFLFLRGGGTFIGWVNFGYDDREHSQS